MPEKSWKLAVLLIALTLNGNTIAEADSESSDPYDPLVPDLRESKVPLQFGRGDFVAVPIPFSNPTLGTGLVVGAGYFHAQTPEQKTTQPPSVTGAAAMYSDNGSYAVGVGNASYWNEDRWRFKGGLGYANLELPLLVGELGPVKLEFDWLVDGALAFGEISRKIGGNWYLGVRGRYMTVDQSLDLEASSDLLLLRDEIVAAGLGVSLEYDTRDLPSNPYSGRHFTASTLFNRTALGGDDNYDSYSLKFLSYHRLAEPFVLAWMVSGCDRSGPVPLWDACMLNLRGAPVTHYMGRSALMAEIEGRWRFSKRWGAVAFTGAGQVRETLVTEREGDVVQNYGVGIRFMVSTAQRINVRLDYGRTGDDSAVILSVGEAF
ncbi:MAG: hypothetical protein V2I79_02470 [Xanthomonadales bacterium]|jgi:hypothetical protein|nr:hypothetical protein [Xanthomonadales bacterium]